MRSRFIHTLVVLILALRVPSAGVTQEANSPQSGSSARKVYESATDAIVSITLQNAGGEDIRSGTGFLIDPKWLRDDFVTRLDGLEELGKEYSHVAFVVTNFHVIEGAVGATIRTNPSSVEGRSGSITLRPLFVEIEDRHADIALLSVTASVATPLHLELSAGVPDIGDRVYTIGNALGLTSSLADGIVSGIRTEPTTGVKLLQTTVPISPGSSGGPLLDSEGRVVGIVTGTLVEGQNVNFAVSQVELASFLRYEYRPYRYSSRRSLSARTSPAEDARRSLFQLELAARGMDDQGVFGSPANDTLFKAVTALREGRSEDAAALLKEATPPPRRFLAEFHWAVGKTHYDLFFNEGFDVGKQVRREPNYILAIDALEKSIKLAPDFAPALLLLSSLHALGDNWTQSLITAHSRVNVAPDCDVSYALRGWAFFRLGDSENAISDFQRGIRLNPHSGKLHYQLGMAYGKDDRAVNAFLSAIRLGNSPSVSEFALGGHYRDTGKYEQAIEAYQRALNHDGQSSLAATLRESIEECRKLMGR